MMRPKFAILIDSPLRRLHLRVQGMVQGVGFRPFVYTLATELGLCGWVRNNNAGVDIEIEGHPSDLATFLERLERDRPAQSLLSQLETDWLAPFGYQQFEIQSSTLDSLTKSAWILPDLATCPTCLEEICDPHNRRYQYPFTNCTHCGPRYSILKALPYDRPNTTMRDFFLCLDCQQEYNNPQNRRFHAQPNACPRCGPHLEFWDNQGKAFAPHSSSAELIALAAARIRQGEILALKGLGGFHLLVDARNKQAVKRLRDRKHRPTKPLAVLYPSLESIREDCLVSPTEQNLLTSAAAPIVLLNRKSKRISRLATSIACHQNTLGAMLPYTPLHHLLLTELGFPVVATSGNRSHEPMCIDNTEALQNLGEIADDFLIHNRPITRPVDDSVVRVIEEKSMLLRRARGYAPLPICGTSFEAMPCILAVGSHLKNTVALSLQGQIFISQHLGDLDAAQTVEQFQGAIAQGLKLYEAKPVVIACDAHPDYTSTQFAQVLSQQLETPVIPIQHHYAHVLSGMIDNDLDPPVLGIAWDGTGYGLDDTLWGGEFLAVPDRTGFQRIAHLRTFPLPGGDRATQEPRRAALGLLYEAFGLAAFEMDFEITSPSLKTFQPHERKVLQTMLKNHINTPKTSSVGRLFDAIASLADLCHNATFEGEAAMQLESILESTTAHYPFRIFQNQDGTKILDWQPMVTAILTDREPKSMISAKFHNTLVEMIVAIASDWASTLSPAAHPPKIVLTGGCFQNRFLLTQAIQRLRAEGYSPHWHHQIPPNDGGISTGQLLGAYWALLQQKQQAKGDTPCV